MSAFDATPTLNQNSTAGLQAGDRSVISTSSGIPDGMQPVYLGSPSGTGTIPVGVDGVKAGLLPGNELNKVRRINWYENR